MDGNPFERVSFFPASLPIKLGSCRAVWKECALGWASSGNAAPLTQMESKSSAPGTWGSYCCWGWQDAGFEIPLEVTTKWRGRTTHQKQTSSLLIRQQWEETSSSSLHHFLSLHVLAGFCFHIMNMKFSITGNGGNKTLKEAQVNFVQIFILEGKFSLR